MSPGVISVRGLTAKKIEAEARRLLGLCRQLRRPGPEPRWEKFLAAAYLALNGRATELLTEHDGKFISEACHVEIDRRKVNEWLRSRSYQVLVGQTKIQGQFARGGFARAVTLVLRGLEGGKVPTDRDLMRTLHVPGKKNCSAEDLANFKAAITRMAREIAEWRPKGS